MNIDTHIDRARTRVRDEQAAVDAKIDAFDAFAGRIEDVSTAPTPTTSTGVTTAAGMQPCVTAAADSRCRQVRTAFAETICPHSVDDPDDGGSLLTTIREEFTETIAVALAPTTEASFTPELKRAIVTETKARRAEAAALDRALDRETKQIHAAGDVVDEITGWIVRSDEPPLSAIGFNALRLRYETLEDHRARCEALARRRQAFFERTTNNGIEAGIRHRRLVPYLYNALPVDHPVLAAAAQLDSACREYQRAVCDHLTRRG
ncbi:hypothetical protein [Natronomonas sp. LN261]|uniref:DUF7260 family protein n=1 Tax=Natronomonas sp. LN261 TaxID=2750669 RepID=UPI0015EF2F6A|nr:hypothetical protein [Natronomonas sp. LN261]